MITFSKTTAVAAALLAQVATGHAYAAEDIVGDWACVEQGSADSEGLLGAGYQLGFGVSEQQGPVFKGYVEWDEPRSEVSDSQMASRQIFKEADGIVTFRVPIFGAFALEPGQFFFVEEGDPGHHIGKVLDQSTIEFVYLESGANPLVAVRRCSRR
ncbi:hypothetical protein [uncultured Ruegeria sp.]|uniref:hypothetical protein n=1 Tax=uncultured Ruegeria sp. TaxID=259304 RepID=UPI00262A6C8F|nr:hypothetical protein [uncultured Ruegeria sp.]